MAYVTSWTIYAVIIMLIMMISGLLVRTRYSSSSASASTVSSTSSSSSKTGTQPHILFILVDDLGWGDVGYNRRQKVNPDATPDQIIWTSPPREVQTPNIDRLATTEGMILNRHYVHFSCTGTRVALQSGRLPVHVQTSLKNPEEPDAGMPRNMTGFAEHLQRSALNRDIDSGINSGGYRTHYVGKWDVGMATPKHTPYGRGYHTSLHYFEHKNDYWTQGCMQSTCCPYYGMSETEEERQQNHCSHHHHHHQDDPTHVQGSGVNNGVYDQHYYNLSLIDLWDTHFPATHLNGTDYEEFIFLKRMKRIIRDHGTSESKDPTEPLLLVYAPHVAHCPLQVPQAYLDKFDFMDNDEDQCKAQTQYIIPPSRDGKQSLDQPKYSCRKQYHSMVNLLDDIVGEIVEEFKSAGLWDNTIMIFTSDNGGPTRLEESGSTNFDLRGGKYSEFEGGVRAAAFVSGGYLDPIRRGVVLEEPIHIADWYKTLTVGLAGIEESVVGDDSQNGTFPPIDSLNVWPLLVGATDHSPRMEIPLSWKSLIQGEYKLIWAGSVPQSGWTGPIYPNASSSTSDIWHDLNCSTGCLFNVATDRGEHIDLAQDQPVRLQAMKERLRELRTTFFQNDDVGQDSCPPDIDMPCACWMAINHYGGFLGPYQEVPMDEIDAIANNVTLLTQ
jgi:arylsulfatase A-like enzyme